MNHLEATRRFLELKDLDEVLSECRSLHQMGYRRMGKWSLAQICRHLRMTFDSSIDGYPLWMSFFAPLRPFIRRMMLPRLLRGDSPKGIPTAPMFAPPADLDDAKEIEILTASIHRLQNHQGDFKPHPGFGRMDSEQMKRFHTVHSAHHLGFLVPKLQNQDLMH
jgi:hypothetical protein